MEAIQNIDLISLGDTVISLFTAFVLGGVIGLERQYRQRTAGLRTNVLVAVGAAIFVDTAYRLYGHDGAVHVMAYVVSGIGFLGAGVIMREEGNVRGLNTAATLWCSAAVGACAGADLVLESILCAAFVLATNTLLRPVADRINRQPLNIPAVEVTNTIYVIAPIKHRKDALLTLEQFLEEASYPIHDLVIQPFSTNEIEIKATLAAASIERNDLERVAQQLLATDFISQAFWSPSTTE